MPAIHPGSGIRDILIAAGVLPDGWTVQMGQLADTDKSIGIMDSGGLSAESRLSIDYPAVQVLALGGRGPTGYPDAYTKLIQIRDALVGIPAAPAAYPELTLCRQVGHIVPLGRTDSDRPKFSLNFQLITEPAPAGYRESA
jgi:hypothetical protein